MACSVYVDLNPIRARLADRPETSELTSAHARITALFQDLRTKPDTAAVDANSEAEALANPVTTALVEQRLPVLAGESPPVLTAPAAVEDPGPRANDVPSRRDGLLSPIELDELAEPLMTATPAPQVVAAATKSVGSRRPRRASDRGLLSMTLRSYLELLDWTGRQLRTGTRGLIPQALESILDPYLGYHPGLPPAIMVFIVPCDLRNT